MENLLGFTPKNIIVRMPNWVGDFMMATPVLTDLKKAFPKAFLTAMCKVPLNTLLEQDQEVDEVFRFQKPESSFLRRKERRDIIGKLRHGQYDVGILLTNSFSSAWWFWQGKVRCRIGYSSNIFRRPLLNYALEKMKKKEHQVLFYKKLLAPLGIDISPTLPRLFLGEKEIEKTKELLFQRGYCEGKTLVGIHSGAAYGSAKRWPKERFHEVAKRLIEEKEDLYIVFFGDLAGASLVKEICQGLSSRVINLAGVTSLRELACIIKVCSTLLTNDSGPMHIATALGVPVVALFGSTCERLTGPLDPRAIVIHKEVCRPCFRRSCSKGLICMEAIVPQEVVDKVLQQLQSHQKE